MDSVFPSWHLVLTHSSWTLFSSRWILKVKISATLTEQRIHPCSCGCTFHHTEGHWRNVFTTFSFCWICAAACCIPLCCIMSMKDSWHNVSCSSGQKVPHLALRSSGFILKGNCTKLSTTMSNTWWKLIICKEFILIILSPGKLSPLLLCGPAAFLPYLLQELLEFSSLPRHFSPWWIGLPVDDGDKRWGDG